jgi:DNA-binding CsgD family transcriptional regulator
MRLRLLCTDRSLEDGPGQLATGECYQVGRSTKCAFVVNDLSVSRLHAELTANHDTVSVKDLGSRNGTFVDGVRVAQADVKPGQTLRFGYAQFKLIVAGQHDTDEVESEVSTLIGQLKPTTALDQLTKAERRVFDQLLTGSSEKEVAGKLEISQHTVHNHIKQIYRKLKVNSRPELLALFVPEGKKGE